MQISNDLMFESKLICHVIQVMQRKQQQQQQQHYLCMQKSMQRYVGDTWLINDRQ